MTTPDFRERQYVSRYASDLLGLSVQKAGAPADVDGNSVIVTLVNETAGTTVFSRPATHMGTGLYETQLTSAETSIPGNYRVDWTYALDGISEVYSTFIEVGANSPAFDRLDPGMKALVEDCWIRFADLFDSPDGGPNLMTYFQTNFSRERLAQLLRFAMGRLNTAAQPHQTYSLEQNEGQGQFPIQSWGPLLEQALYVECLKHLVRSYVEQPMFVGGSVTRLDRRDYMDRWMSVLNMEEGLLTKQLEVFKISNMGLGRPRVLVSGGVFGRFGPTRFAGSVAARPRYWTRFY